MFRSGDCLEASPAIFLTAGRIDAFTSGGNRPLPRTMSISFWSRPHTSTAHLREFQKTSEQTLHSLSFSVELYDCYATSMNTGTS
jgi:hypothetical protein